MNPTDMLRAIVEEATRGPWDAKDYRVCANVKPSGPPIKLICDTANNARSRIPENAANARLIALSPLLAQALLDVVERCQREHANHTRTMPEHEGHVLSREVLNIITKALGETK